MTVTLNKANIPENLVQKYLKKEPELYFYESIRDKIKNIFLSFKKFIYTDDNEINEKTLTNQKDEKDSRIEDKSISKGILYGIKVGTIGFIFKNAMLIIFSQLTPSLFTNGKSSEPFTFFDDVIRAPIIEEIIFRELIYNALRIICNIVTKDSTAEKISSIFSSAIFGLGHENSIFKLRSIMIGVSSYFTHLQAYKKYGLYSSIISHMTNNFIAYLVCVVFNLDKK